MPQEPSPAVRRPSPKAYSIDLLTLQTDDGRLLDGALYVPQQAELLDVAILIVHGKAGNFYTCVSGFLPPLFAEIGLSSFSMNMRFHDLGYNRAELPASGSASGAFRMAGGAWEKLEEGHRDLKVAVEMLHERGYNRVVLCGHSSGGFYAVDYVGRFHDVAALALLSPLTTNKTPLRIWFPKPGDLEAVRQQAEAMVADDRGHELIPLNAWYYAISAASLLDRLDERQGWFDDALASASIPTLWLFGSTEDRVDLWRRYYQEMRHEQKRLAVIDGADHQYLGYEQPVYEAIKQFLDEFSLTR